MKIGYARKSTHLQDVAHQVDELTKAVNSSSVKSEILLPAILFSFMCLNMIFRC